MADYFKGTIGIKSRVTHVEILVVWGAGENVDYYAVKIGNEVRRVRANKEGFWTDLDGSLSNSAAEAGKLILNSSVSYPKKGNLS